MAKRCRTSDISRTKEEESRVIAGSGGEDYISQLPESTITHILSRLPTKEAIRTSVLSKDWEYKWTSIYDIALSDFMQSATKHVFVDFMERISRLSLSYNVRDFSLLCGGGYEETHMRTWILPILGPNLETFTLGMFYKGFVIPQDLLKCTSLRRLVLALRCTFKVPAMFTFPSLTYLDLSGVAIVNENSNSDTMILKFPLLKKFELKKSKWWDVKFVEIHAPRLETLVSETTLSGAVHDYSIKIPGATLLIFEICGGLLDRFDLTESTVVCANLHTSFELQTLERSGLQVQKLFNELSSMLCLQLKGAMMKGFTQSNLRLPKYDKLKRIYIFDGGNLSLLLKLLHASPYLNTLEIAVRGWDDYDYDEVENVPHCLACSLKNVRFDYSTYTPKPMFCLERFILKFGTCLKKVCFTVDDASQQDEIYLSLSTLPVVSSSLEIVVG